MSSFPAVNYIAAFSSFTTSSHLFSTRDAFLDKRRDFSLKSEHAAALFGTNSACDSHGAVYIFGVKKIFEFLKNGFHGISSSLDLSYEYDLVADEKIPFLADLASVLHEHSFFPYEPPAGSKRFRNLIADFMKMHHHIPLNADALFRKVRKTY